MSRAPFEGFFAVLANKRNMAACGCSMQHVTHSESEKTSAGNAKQGDRVTEVFGFCVVVHATKERTRCNLALIVESF